MGKGLARKGRRDSVQPTQGDSGCSVQAGDGAPSDPSEGARVNGALQPPHPPFTHWALRARASILIKFIKEGHFLYHGILPHSTSTS